MGRSISANHLFSKKDESLLSLAIPYLSGIFTRFQLIVINENYNIYEFSLKFKKLIHQHLNILMYPIL